MIILWDLIINLWHNESVEFTLKLFGLFCIILLLRYTKFKPSQKALALLIFTGFLVLYAYSTDEGIRQSWDNIEKVNVEVQTKK